MTDALVLMCGEAGAATWEGTGAGAAARRHPVPSLPGRTAVDPLLGTLVDGRVVVVGTDADLAAVVVRMVRTARMVPIGYLPVAPDSAVARLWGLGASATEIALHGQVRPIPLIRDDNGGVLVGRGVLHGVDGPIEGEAYCDDALAFRGQARRVEVTPDPQVGAGLLARTVRPGLLRRSGTLLRGRAYQLGAHAVVAEYDGVTHPRPLTRWTWYRHTEDLPAVRP